MYYRRKILLNLIDAFVYTILEAIIKKALGATCQFHDWYFLSTQNSSAGIILGE